MPQFYNSYCSYVFILGEEDTIFQYNSKILKKKKKTIESPYQLATIASTSCIALAFCNHIIYIYIYIYGGEESGII